MNRRRQRCLRRAESRDRCDEAFYYLGVTEARRKLERRLSNEVIALTSTGNRLRRTFATESELHETDFRALAVICMAASVQGHVTPAILGERLSLSSAAVTYVVDRLGRAGLVERLPDPQDGRRVILRRSEKGRSLIGRFFDRAEQHHQDALTDFDDEQIATAAKVLKAVNEGILAYHDELNRDVRPASSEAEADAEDEDESEAESA